MALRWQNSLDEVYENITRFLKDFFNFHLKVYYKQPYKFAVFYIHLTLLIFKVFTRIVVDKRQEGFHHI